MFPGPSSVFSHDIDTEAADTPDSVFVFKRMMYATFTVVCEGATKLESVYVSVKQ